MTNVRPNASNQEIPYPAHGAGIVGAQQHDATLEEPGNMHPQAKPPNSAGLVKNANCNIRD
jgi:hypothetical protein